jgi:hypothetical protein
MHGSGVPPAAQRHPPGEGASALACLPLATVRAAQLLGVERAARRPASCSAVLAPRHAAWLGCRGRLGLLGARRRPMLTR